MKLCSVLLLFSGSIFLAQGFAFNKNVAAMQCLTRYKIPPRKIEFIATKRMVGSRIFNKIWNNIYERKIQIFGRMDTAKQSRCYVLIGESQDETKKCTQGGDDDVENIKNRKMPESKEGKCFMACVLKQLNVINREGKFEVNTVKGWMADKYKDNTQKLNRAYARADSCAEQLSSQGADDCEYAAKILECSKQKKRIRN